jgi:hypothetical protein
VAGLSLAITVARILRVRHILRDVPAAGIRHTLMRMHRHMKAATARPQVTGPARHSAREVLAGRRRYATG